MKYCISIFLAFCLAVSAQAQLPAAPALTDADLAFVTDSVLAMSTEGRQYSGSAYWFADTSLFCGAFCYLDLYKETPAGRRLIGTLVYQGWDQMYMYAIISPAWRNVREVENQIFTWAYSVAPSELYRANLEINLERMFQEWQTLPPRL